MIACCVLNNIALERDQSLLDTRHHPVENDEVDELITRAHNDRNQNNDSRLRRLGFEKRSKIAENTFGNRR